MSTDVETSIANLLNQTAALEAELERWRAERVALDARIAVRERLIAALRSEADFRGTRLFDPPPVEQVAPHTPSTNGNGNGKGAPGTNDAIVAVLEAAEAELTSDEVWAELERRGWAPLDATKPRNALRTALWSLADKGKIEKSGTRKERRWGAKSLNGSAPTQAGGP